MWRQEQDKWVMEVSSAIFMLHFHVGFLLFGKGNNKTGTHWSHKKGGGATLFPRFMNLSPFS